ncbi:MAG: polyprenyl synthetase family protein [Betaproteobacteria bacterium]|jgi:farnesyl diphosphate synthase|nr:MAG: polyprenyl synthetase family protein [Betaproteobacteria bacterium]
MLERQGRVEAALDCLLPGVEHAPARLHSAMRYAVLGGGKRVRPLLAYAAGELVAAKPGHLDLVASSLELIHAYSLVHDDLPCMDNDRMRRGKPTVHVEYDEATALLVGDSLHSLAFQALTDNALVADATRQLAMAATLARAAGSSGMAGGQAIDLQSVGKRLSLPELEFMHVHKTGALIRASVQLGAMCADSLGAIDLELLDRFGKLAGLGFQLVDDVLDAESSTATLGKTVGKDAMDNKPTYVTAVGVERSRKLASELCEEALAVLEQFPRGGERLGDLTRFIFHREF